MAGRGFKFQRRIAADGPPGGVVEFNIEAGQDDCALGGTRDGRQQVRRRFIGAGRARRDDGA